MLKVDLELVQNITSPAALHFYRRHKIYRRANLADLAERILENNRTERPISLLSHSVLRNALLVFVACTTVITLNHKQGQTYIDYLEKKCADEHHAQPAPQSFPAPLGLAARRPSFSDEIRRLAKSFHRHFTFAKDVEAGAKSIPRRLTKEHVVALREVVLSRLPRRPGFVPKFRNPSIAFNLKHDRASRGLDPRSRITSVNFDLIYVSAPDRRIFNALSTMCWPSSPIASQFQLRHVPWVKPAQKFLSKKFFPLRS